MPAAAVIQPVWFLTMSEAAFREVASDRKAALVVGSCFIAGEPFCTAQSCASPAELMAMAPWCFLRTFHKGNCFDDPLAAYQIPEESLSRTARAGRLETVRFSRLSRPGTLVQLSS